MSKAVSEAREEGSSCPECIHGLIERVEFGHGKSLEIHEWCGGLNGDKEEGCGWEEIYTDKTKTK